LPGKQVRGGQRKSRPNWQLGNLKMAEAIKTYFFALRPREGGSRGTGPL
jgi:hypothetical protein